jgi:hypothetical protein
MTPKPLNQRERLANPMPQARLFGALGQIGGIMPCDLAQNFGFAALAAEMHQHIDFENDAIGIGDLASGLRNYRQMGTELINHGKKQFPHAVMVERLLMN